MDYNLKTGYNNTNMVSSVVYGWLVSLPSSDVNALAELAVTVSSLKRFHSVTLTVVTKNEFNHKWIKETMLINGFRIYLLSE